MQRLSAYSYLFFSMIVFSSCRYDAPDYWYKNYEVSDLVQIDRVGIPYLDQLLSSTDVLQALSLGDPSTDVELIATPMASDIDSIRAKFSGVAGFPVLDANALTPDSIVQNLLPNVMTVDLSREFLGASFNGHSPQDDDAFDALLQMILGRKELEDSIVTDAESKRIDKFPYVNRQHY